MYEKHVMSIKHDIKLLNVKSAITRIRVDFSLKKKKKNVVKIDFTKTLVRYCRFRSIRNQVSL